MRKMIHVAVALVVGGLLTVGAQTQAPAKGSIASVAWMEGTWVNATGSKTVEEHWTSPSGSAMLAVSRTIANGALADFEFLRIVERGGSLVYIAQPGGRPPIEFAMTNIDAQSVTFENPQHDFPKVIRYEKRTNGTLVASIAGTNGARPMSWVFTQRSSASK